MEKTYKLSFKKRSETTKDIIAKSEIGIKFVVGQYAIRKNWVSTKGSKLRNKVKTIRSISWNTDNLSKIFGTRIFLWSRYTKETATIVNSGSLIRAVKITEFATDLNDLALLLQIDIKFE